MTTPAAPPLPAAVPTADTTADTTALTTALDPAALARRSAAVPPPGPAVDQLVAAARTLAAAVAVLLPAAEGHPAGGRSASLAEALAEHWAGLGRAWARDVEHHTALVAGTGAALAEVDRAYGTGGGR